MDFEGFNFRIDPDESMHVDFNDYSLIMDQKKKNKSKQEWQLEK